MCTDACIHTKKNVFLTNNLISNNSDIILLFINKQTNKT